MKKKIIQIKLFQVIFPCFLIFTFLNRSVFAIPYSYSHSSNAEEFTPTLGRGFNPRIGSGGYIRFYTDLTVESDYTGNHESLSFEYHILNKTSDVEAVSISSDLNSDLMKSRYFSKKLAENELWFMVIGKKFFPAERAVSFSINQKFSHYNLAQSKFYFGPEVITERKRGAIVKAVFRIKNLDSSAKASYLNQLSTIPRGRTGNLVELSNQLIQTTKISSLNFSLINYTSTAKVDFVLTGGPGRASMINLFDSNHKMSESATLPLILQKIQEYLDHTTYDNSSPIWFGTTPIEKVLNLNTEAQTTEVAPFDSDQFNALQSLYNDLSETQNEILSVARGKSEKYQKPTEAEYNALMQAIEKYGQAMKLVKEAQKNCLKERSSPYVCDYEIILAPLPKKIPWPAELSSSYCSIS